MAKICPETNEPVLYLNCLECEDKNCKKESGKVKNKKEDYIKKSDVLLLIQNRIRAIQMNDYGTDSGITQLYSVMSDIEKLQGESVNES